MSLTVKAGTKLFGAACATEVVVVKAPADPVDLKIGGHPPVLAAADRPGGLEVTTPAEAKPAMGKRYVDAAGTVEVLCTKPGDGAVSLGDEILVQKDAKALPASD